MVAIVSKRWRLIAICCLQSFSPRVLLLNKTVDEVLMKHIPTVYIHTHWHTNHHVSAAVSMCLWTPGAWWVGSKRVIILWQEDFQSNFIYYCTVRGVSRHMVSIFNIPFRPQLNPKRGMKRINVMISFPIKLLQCSHDTTCRVNLFCKSNCRLKGFRLIQWSYFPLKSAKSSFL